MLDENILFDIDELTRVVNMLVQDALKEEHAGVRHAEWLMVLKAFQTRVYPGTYLDWQALAARLSHFFINELRQALACYGYAPDEQVFFSPRSVS